MTTRRNLLVLTAGLGVLRGTMAQALESEIAKDEVGYQDVPRDGHVCAQCVYFVFGNTTGTTLQSRCKLVAGPINPAGWCQIWSPKSAG